MCNGSVVQVFETASPSQPLEDAVEAAHAIMPGSVRHRRAADDRSVTATTMLVSPDHTDGEHAALDGPDRPIVWLHVVPRPPVSIRDAVYLVPAARLRVERRGAGRCQASIARRGRTSKTARRRRPHVISTAAVGQRRYRCDAGPIQRATDEGRFN